MISHHISKSQTGKELERISDAWGFEMPRLKNLVVHDIAEDARLMTSRDIAILNMNETYLPFLSCEALLDRFPAVRVDMGAVRFVCNGADIMRPGITSHDTFGPDEVVCIAEPGGRFLAVGLSRIDSRDMDVMKRGNVVNNLHYISDKYWEAGKPLVT